MTSIVRVLTVPAVGAGYCEDLAALQKQPMPVSQRFAAAPVSPGFQAIREVAEGVSVGLVLSDATQDSGGGRRVAWGDCIGVAYSARAGRDPVFRGAEGSVTIDAEVAPFLQGLRLTSFRELSSGLDALTESVPSVLAAKPRGALSRRDLLTAPARVLQIAKGEQGFGERVTVERRLHTAVRYGVSQALLRAVALARGLTMTEVIAEEWGLPLPEMPVPLHAQSGSDRNGNAEKMIARRVASLPHGLVDNIPAQVGTEGSEMTRYLRWLSERVRDLAPDDYLPTIHLDLHGALGHIYDNNLGLMLGQLYAWALAAKPYPLRIESPMILSSREQQIDQIKTLREYVRARGMKCQLVADEWANTLEDIGAFLDAGAVDMVHVRMPALGGIHNTVEAILACKAAGIGVLLGGSYIETDLCARVSAHVALATRPDLVMAKPGVGVDEAIAVVENEMARALAQIPVPQTVGAET